MLFFSRDSFVCSNDLDTQDTLDVVILGNVKNITNTVREDIFNVINRGGELINTFYYRYVRKKYKFVDE